MAREKEKDNFVIDLLLSYALPVDISKNIARSDRLSYRLMLPGRGACTGRLQMLQLLLLLKFRLNRRFCHRKRDVKEKERARVGQSTSQQQ